MARKPMVTRTMKNTEATFLCLDVAAAEPFNETVTLSGTFKSEEAILKAGKEKLDTEVLKTVHLVDYKIKRMFYKMDEQKFIDHADEVIELE